MADDHVTHFPTPEDKPPQSSGCIPDFGVLLLFNVSASFTTGIALRCQQAMCGMTELVGFDTGLVVLYELARAHMEEQHGAT